MKWIAIKLIIWCGSDLSEECIHFKNFELSKAINLIWNLLISVETLPYYFQKRKNNKPACYAGLQKSQVTIAQFSQVLVTNPDFGHCYGRGGNFLTLYCFFLLFFFWFILQNKLYFCVCLFFPWCLCEFIIYFFFFFLSFFLFFPCHAFAFYFRSTPVAYPRRNKICEYQN